MASGIECVTKSSRVVAGSSGASAPRRRTGLVDVVLDRLDSFWAMEVLRGAEQVYDALSRHPELVDRMLADAGPSVVRVEGGEAAEDAAESAE